jgi:hypothetical protein
MGDFVENQMLRRESLIAIDERWKNRYILMVKRYIHT